MKRRSKQAHARCVVVTAVIVLCCTLLQGLFKSSFHHDSHNINIRQNAAGFHLRGRVLNTLLMRRSPKRSFSKNSSELRTPFNNGSTIAQRQTREGLLIPNSTTTLWEAAISKYLEGHQKRCERLQVKHVEDYLTKDLCDCSPGTLIHQIHPTEQNISLETIELSHYDVAIGGHWQPTSCLPRMRVAIIIPFRNRWHHLVTLLRYLHPMLQGQLLYYVIVVVEQNEPRKFNKAALMNIGYQFVARAPHSADCVVFHDVDLIPEDGRHMYYCQHEPLHLGAYNSKHKYKILYPGILGGAVALRPKIFTSINGFSNRFWGWGGEDDELSYRLKAAGYKIVRDPRQVSGYLSLSHPRDPGNRQTDKRRMMKTLLKDFKPKKDGLNSINYTIKQQELFRLFTLLLVDLHHKMH